MSNKRSQQHFQQDSRFKMKVDTDMVMSVIYSLIMNIKNKDILPYDHLKTFDFMADHLNDRFYEQRGKNDDNKSCKKK